MRGALLCVVSVSLAASVQTAAASSSRRGLLRGSSAAEERRELITEENVFAHNSSACRVDIVGGGNTSFCDGALVRARLRRSAAQTSPQQPYSLCTFHTSSHSGGRELTRTALSHPNPTQLRALYIGDYDVADPLVATPQSLPYGMHVTSGDNNSYTISWCAARPLPPSPRSHPVRAGAQSRQQQRQ